MPTNQELEGLFSNCSWTWISVNGVNGYKVSGKGAYSGASIFLPAAGYGYGASLDNAGSYGYYWSSVPYSGYYYGSWYLGFDSNYHLMGSIYGRYYGFPVRPVSDVH